MDEQAPAGGTARRMPRRSFLRGAIILTGGTALLAACAPATPTAPTAAPAKPTEAPKPAAPAAPAAAPTQAAPAVKPADAPAAPKPADAAKPAAKAPKPGGTLVMAKTAEATDLDPQLTSSLSRWRTTGLFYNNLVRLGTDISVQPDLAESWKVAPDGKKVDFKLRQGVKWHPPVNRELVADDVKFSYERLLKDSPGKTDFAVIEGIEVVDKYTVSFVLKEPNAGLLASMASVQWGAIVNRETVEKNGDLRKTAVGTGPFILEDWKVEQETKLKKNPEYWERGKPYVDNVVLKIIPDEANIVAGLRTGAIHHAMMEDNKNFDLLKNEAKLTAHRTSRLGYEFFNFNQKNPPFDKIQVIQAINYAVDRDELIKATAQGYGVLTAPATPPMKQWQLDKAKWEPFYKVDLERAKKLLAEAGHPNGFQMTLLTIPTLPTMFTNAQVVQAQLKKIGIDVKVESVEYALWIQRWQKKEWDATVNTTGGYPDPDTAFYRAFHSKAQNWNNYNNPDVDKLLDQGRAESDTAKRKPIYDQVQLQLLEKPAQLYLFTAEMIDFTQSFVQGFEQHPMTALWTYHNVWLDQ